MCRFYNKVIRKTKYANSEVEAAEIFDKVSLHLLGENCFINFQERRQEYLDSDLKSFYENTFLKAKKRRIDGYLKDDSDLLEKIKPLLWKMSVPKMADYLSTTSRRIACCIKKHNLNSPGKNYWQKNRTKNAEK